MTRHSMMMRAAARFTAVAAAEASVSSSHALLHHSHSRFFASHTCRLVGTRIVVSNNGGGGGGGFAPAAGMATSMTPLSAAAAASAATTNSTAGGGGGGSTSSAGGGGGGGGGSTSWLSAAVLFAPTAVCAFLCKWQVDRYQWKRGEIDARESALTAPDLTAADLAEMAKRGERPTEYARVFLEGELEVDKKTTSNKKASNKKAPKTIHITPRTRSVHGSPIPGSIVITALKPRRPRNAPHVLVNRGWAPDTWSEPSGGTCVKCVGVVRDSETPSAFTPDNVPADNAWHWIDVPAIAAAMGLPPGTPLVQLVHEGGKDTGKAAPSSYPAPPALADLRGFKAGGFGGFK